MHSYKEIFGGKKKILFVTAHPDDVDVFFSGTIARLRHDKKEVFVLVITNGARGSRENKISEAKLAKIRKQEQINALKEAGVSKENFATLNYKDGEAENNMKLIGKISYYIRKFKPDLVATHDPKEYYANFDNAAYINHKDHRITGISTLDAIYPFSRDLSFFPDHAKKGITPHTVFDILLTSFEGNTQTDITDFVDKKKKALLSHKSQFNEKTVNEILSFSKKGKKYFEGGNYLKLSW